MTERPLGVTIIGILWIIGGILAIVRGLGIVVLGSVVAGVFGLFIGAAGLIIGFVYLVLGVGCFKGWPWVWTVGVIFSIISIIMGLFSLFSTGAGALLDIVIAAVILYYLFRPNVKAWFGKT